MLVVHTQQQQQATVTKKTAGQKVIDVALNILAVFVAIFSLYNAFWYYLAFMSVKEGSFGYLFFSTLFLVMLLVLAVVVYRNVITKKYKSVNAGLIYMTIVLTVINIFAFFLLLTAPVQVQF